MTGYSMMRGLGLALALFAVAPTARAEPVHAVAMHGEPKYGPDFKHFGYVNPDAPKGGTIRLGVVGDTYTTFNPFTLRGVPAAGVGDVYETLMESSADEAFTEYGLLAETIEMPEDRSWVAFTLRKEARWHDGKPVTVDDVIFSLEALREKGRPFYRYYYKNIVAAEKIGERTVKFTFSEGENRELPLIAGQLAILPKHYWEGRDFEATTMDPPLGSGPYRVKTFEPGRSVTYERVADYWGADLAVRRGRHNADIIRYDYYRDGTVALEAFKAGEYDFREENSSRQWATGYDSPALRAGLFHKIEIPHDLPTGMQGFAFNTRKELFKDKRVREALAYAFDFEWTNQNLFYGQYTRTKSYFSNSELASEGLPSKAELEILEPLRGRIPDEVFTQEYDPPSGDGSGNIRQNLREAQKLLQEAGWSIRNRRLQHDETRRIFAFEILLNSPEFERIVLPFVRNLERLGIAASVRTVDTAQYRRRLDEYDFDMVVSTFGQSLSPGNEQRDFWGAEAADQPGSRNLIGIKDPAIDELIELVITAPDREALITRTRALDRVLLWNHFMIPQWHIQSFRVAYWDKFRRPETPPKYGLAFESWWVDPGRESQLKEKKAKAKN